MDAVNPSSSAVAAGPQTVNETAALLLRTGNFSDLTFTCQDQQFFVHRAIVCPRSPVWTAAIQGNFKEATTKELIVDIADPPTLLRALSYLYTGDYDDEKLLPIDYIVPEAGCQPQTSNDEPTASEMMNDVVQSPQDNGIEQEQAAPLPDEPQAQAEAATCSESESIPTATMVDGGVEYCSCYTVDSDTKNPSCNNAKLRTNARIYIFADYYQIPELKQLAVQKFGAALHEICCPECFSDICLLVATSTNSKALELRFLLTAAIVENGAFLIANTYFMETLLGLPQLLRDCFSHSILLCQSVAESREAARAHTRKVKKEADEAKQKAQEKLNAAHKKNLDDVNEANKKTQDAKNHAEQIIQRIAKDMRDAKKCKHCKLDSNVLFDPEPSTSGQFHYVLRCKCRTKY